VKDEEENIEEGEPHGNKDRVVVKFIYHSDIKGMKWGSHGLHGLTQMIPLKRNEVCPQMHTNTHR